MPNRWKFINSPYILPVILGIVKCCKIIGNSMLYIASNWKLILTD